MNRFKNNDFVGRTATTKLTEIWHHREVTKNTELRLKRRLFFPIETYAAEKWTIKKADADCMNELKMEKFPRMRRIP